MKYLLFLLFPIIGFSQPNYSLSITPQYAFNKFQIGVTGIMEERIASFESHFLLDKLGEPSVQIKLGVTLFSDCNSRMLLYPFYFNYKERDYFTPMGINWTTTRGIITFNGGLDVYRQSEVIEGMTTKGKIRPNFNASINVKMFGQRYKKINKQISHTQNKLKNNYYGDMLNK